MHNLACYLPSDNGLIGPCIVFPEWFIIEFNWVAPYNVSSLLENLTKLSSKTESWLVRRVFWIKDWVLFWTGVNGSSSHGINFRPIKNVKHLCRELFKSRNFKIHAKRSLSSLFTQIHGITPAIAIRVQKSDNVRKNKAYFKNKTAALKIDI